MAELFGLQKITFVLTTTAHLVTNMDTAENRESSIWNNKPQNDGLAIKIFSETCCNGCTCSSSNDHKQESKCFCGDEVCSC